MLPSKFELAIWVVVHGTLWVVPLVGIAPEYWRPEMHTYAVLWMAGVVIWGAAVGLLLVLPALGTYQALRGTTERTK